MSDGWVVDRGLDVLLRQINEAAPNRSKVSDGSIGDADHQAQVSDHNPQESAGDNPPNQVDARDFTHDPAAGADMAVVADALRRSRDRRISYVIFAGRIFSSYATSSRAAWTWGPYSGTNQHHHHMHVSVNDVHNDETQLWSIGIGDDMTPGELLGTKLGASGPNVAVALQDTYRASQQLLAAAAADETRDAVMLAAIQALSGGGVDTGAVVAAVRDAAAQTAAAVTALQERVAELETALADRDARLAAALAPEAGA